MFRPILHILFFSTKRCGNLMSRLTLLQVHFLVAFIQRALIILLGHQRMPNTAAKISTFSLVPFHH